MAGITGNIWKWLEIPGYGWNQADINFSSASGRSFFSSFWPYVPYLKILRQNRAYFKFSTQTRKFQSGPCKIYSIGSRKSDFCKILHDEGGGGVQQKVTMDDKTWEAGGES